MPEDRELSPPPDLAAKPSGLALAWVQRRIRDRLQQVGVTPSTLVASLGGSESSWRNKLNGNRGFHLDDLVLIAMAVDAGLFESLPIASSDLADFFPPEFRPRLSHTTLGLGMPTLTQPVVDWPMVGRNVASWLANEHVAGRGWLIGPSGLARQVLVQVDHALPSVSASLALATETALDIEWVGNGLLLRITCNTTRIAAGVTTTDVREAHANFGNDLANLAAADQEDKVLLTVMPQHALAALDEVIGLADAPTDGWMLGLDRLHRLARNKSAPWVPSEVHLARLAHDRDTGMVCLRVK